MLATTTLALASVSCCCCGSLVEKLAGLAGVEIPGMSGASADAPVAGLPSTTPPPAPTDIAPGPLTAAAILASADAVSTFYPWEWSLGEMQHRLGKPTRIDGERYAWAVMDGKDCVGTSMEHIKGQPMMTPKGQSAEQVGIYTAGQRFPAEEGNPYFAECVEDAGGAK